MKLIFMAIVVGFASLANAANPEARQKFLLKHMKTCKLNDASSSAIFPLLADMPASVKVSGHQADKIEVSVPAQIPNPEAAGAALQNLTGNFVVTGTALASEGLQANELAYGNQNATILLRYSDEVLNGDRGYFEVKVLGIAKVTGTESDADGVKSSVELNLICQ